MLKHVFQALPATLAGIAMVAIVFSIPALMLSFPISVHVSVPGWAQAIAFSKQPPNSAKPDYAPNP